MVEFLSWILLLISFAYIVGIQKENTRLKRGNTEGRVESVAIKAANVKMENQIAVQKEKILELKGLVKKREISVRELKKYKTSIMTSLRELLENENIT